MTDDDAPVKDRAMHPQFPTIEAPVKMRAKSRRKRAAKLPAVAQETGTIVESADALESKPVSKPHRWAPGQSGNPGGRKPMPPEMRLMALEAAPDALELAIRISRRALKAEIAEKPLTTHSESHVRWATDTVLERALGRPEQAVSVTGDAHGPAIQPVDLVALLEALRSEQARREIVVNPSVPGDPIAKTP